MKAETSASVIIPLAPDALMYARVSSKDQEKEGFSVPAQLDLLRRHALERHMRVLQEFVDVETAKQAGRASFAEMVAFHQGASGAPGAAC